MIFPECDAALRTDLAFSRHEEEDHQIGETPLEKLKLGLVSQFPLDYMHMVCLEVTRRLILAWLRGPLKCRLSSRTVTNLSSELVQMRSYIPAEFARKPSIS